MMENGKTAFISRVFLVFIFIFSTGMLTAENEPTIAILDVAPKYVDQAKADVIYELILDKINRSGLYVVVERAALAKVLDELKVSLSDMIDETTAVKIGKLAGAQFVLVSSLLFESNTYYLSIRIVSIETGKILRTSVKNTDNFTKINDLASMAVEYLLDTGKTDNGRQTGKENPPHTPFIRLVAGGIFAIPLLDDTELFNPGGGGMLGLDFRIATIGPGNLFFGFKVLGIINTTVDLVTDSYLLMDIPVWLSVSYSFRMLAPVEFVLEMDGGLTVDGFFYANPYHDKTDKVVLIPGICPGIGISYEFNENIGMDLFGNFLMVFYDTYPLTGITASLRMHLMF
jgi:hypothetical protein